MQESELHIREKKNLVNISKIAGKVRGVRKINISHLKSKFQRLFSFAKSHKVTSVGVILVALLILFVAVAKINGGKSGAVVNESLGTSAQVVVGKSFNVAIKNADGKPTGQDLKITITTVEEADSILIQNKPAKTKTGKTFLLINMEIQNDTKSELKVKPVDMVRLVGVDGKTYAADVYNNDVNAEAVSLRKTRIGYVVDDTQKTFRLLIGEVRDEQEPIDVSF